MIQEVNSALLEMQGALLARSLYPEGHPRIGTSEERACELLAQILRERDDLTMLCVEGRVICDNEILPSSPTLADTLFHMLYLKGVDRITIRRGLRQEELRDFLDTLNAVGGSGGLQATPHITFASLNAVNRTPVRDAIARRSTAAEYAEQAAEVLPGIWDGLGESNPPQDGVLGDIVHCISRVVSDSASALIPLAPLKKHDEYTFVHTVNVSILSISLAEALGFGGDQTYELSVAALLHDVGKQKVPDEILNKNGLYTTEERRVMETHSAEGARILLNTPGIPEIAVIVAYEHHIRADGGGYPRVPKDWRLNLASRIVQMADVFDALRTNRPYRPGLPLPRIVDVMRNEAGTFFDADLLEVFLQEVVSRGIPESPDAPMKAAPASPAAP